MCKAPQGIIHLALKVPSPLHFLDNIEIFFLELGQQENKCLWLIVAVTYLTVAQLW